MAQGSFDYDLLNYDVIGRSDIRRPVYPSSYYGSVYHDDWCCLRSYGHSGFAFPFGFFLRWALPAVLLRPVLLRLRPVL